jgi:hypothetical protein
MVVVFVSRQIVLSRGWEGQALSHCFGLSVGRATMQM